MGKYFLLLYTFLYFLNSKPYDDIQFNTLKLKKKEGQKIIPVDHSERSCQHNGLGGKISNRMFHPKNLGLGHVGPSVRKLLLLPQKEAPVD